MKIVAMSVVVAVLLASQSGIVHALDVDIADIQVYDATGAPDVSAMYYGTEVTVRGFITCTALTYNNGTHYVQDATGGVNFYLAGTGLVLGDEVEVTGIVGQFSGEIDLGNPTVNFIAPGTPPDPAELAVGTLINTYYFIGRLVSTSGYVTNLGTNSFELQAGDDLIFVYIDSDTHISLADVQEGDEYRVTGPCVNYATLIEIKPRFQDDLLEDPEGEPLRTQPSSWGAVRALYR